MKRTEQTGDWKEWRRRRGWKLYQQGWKQKDIANVLGVTEGAVSQWAKRGRERGEEGLYGRIADGPKSRLTDEQQAQIPEILGKGAEAFGYRGQVWTAERVAGVIWHECGVRYHPASCSRLLRRLKYSVQKPIALASQRDEEVIEQWKKQQWTEIRKKAKEEKRTIVFVDESGWYLLPMAVRTYAPRGQTPIFKVKLTHDHLSSIGGITPEGRIFMQIQKRAYRAETVIDFLRLLLQKISGNILVIWDGAPIHRARAIKEFLAKGAARRLHLERLPSYAPDLNPQEGVWNLLKRRELKNLCCQDLTQLEQELVRAKERLRHRKKILKHCFSHALGEEV